MAGVVVTRAISTRCRRGNGTGLSGSRGRFIYLYVLTQSLSSCLPKSLATAVDEIPSSGHLCPQFKACKWSAVVVNAVEVQEHQACFPRRTEEAHTWRQARPCRLGRGFGIKLASFVIALETSLGRLEPTHTYPGRFKDPGP
jgi:hypothetical protein